jgi:hypothetical protein
MPPQQMGPQDGSRFSRMGGHQYEYPQKLPTAQSTESCYRNQVHPLVTTIIGARKT